MINLPDQLDPVMKHHINQLKSIDPSERRYAARFLGDMRNKAILAVPFIVELLEDDTPIPEFKEGLGEISVYPSVEAALALGKIGHPSAVSALIEALSKNNHQLTIAAASALGEVGHSSAVPALIKALSGSNHMLMASSAIALGQIGDRTAVDSLIFTLENANPIILHNGLAKDLVLALGNIGDVKAVKPLIERLLSDDYWYIHEVICSSLAAIGDKAAIDPLVTCLLNAKCHIKIAACNALKEFGDARVIPALIRTLRQDHADWELRWIASDALGRIGKDSVEPLLNVLKKGSQSSRFLAVSALGHIKEKDTVPILIQTLQDDQVREAAVKALGAIGDVAAIGPLIEVLQEYRTNLSQSKNIRKLIAKTLRKLSGYKCGGDPIQWRVWWEQHKMEYIFDQPTVSTKQWWQFWK